MLGMPSHTMEPPARSAITAGSSLHYNSGQATHLAGLLSKSIELGVGIQLCEEALSWDLLPGKCVEKAHRARGGQAVGTRHHQRSEEREPPQGTPDKAMLMGLHALYHHHLVTCPPSMFIPQDQPTSAVTYPTFRSNGGTFAFHRQLKSDKAQPIPPLGPKRLCKRPLSHL